MFTQLLSIPFEPNSHSLFVVYSTYCHLQNINSELEVLSGKFWQAVSCWLKRANKVSPAHIKHS